MAREVKQLGENELREVSARVRQRMIEKLGEAKVRGWIFSNTAVCEEFAKQTYIAVREQIEMEQGGGS